MDRWDVEEKLGRDLNDEEIAEVRSRVDRACPRIFVLAEQLELDLQPA